MSSRPPVATRWLASAVAAATALLVACSEPKPEEPAAPDEVEVTQIVFTYKTPNSPKSTRTKEQASAVAKSIQASLVGGRDIKDFLPFTDLVDKGGLPLNGGRFKHSRTANLPPALRDALFATPVGGIGAGPFEIAVGFVVFRRER